MNALNNFDQYVIDGYVCDLVSPDFTIKNPSGEIVYSTNPANMTNRLLIDLDNDGIKDEAGNAIFDKIIAFKETILDINANAHYHGEFAETSQDFGSLVDEPNIGNYQEFKDFYLNRPFEHIVFSGVFSKAFIDTVRSEFGIDQVKVLNVVRNPSVAYLLDDSYKIEEIENAVHPTKGSLHGVGNRLFTSFLCSMKLTELEYVTTIKFEDILVNGGFDFEGVYITTSEHGNDNGILTQYEREIVIPVIEKSSVTLDNLEFFNDVFSNFNEVATNFPNSFFEALGYTPLSYDDIIE